MLTGVHDPPALEERISASRKTLFHINKDSSAESLLIKGKEENEHFASLEMQTILIPQQFLQPDQSGSGRQS